MTKPEVWKILIDQDPYDWEKSTITGNEIRTLAGVDPKHSVFLKVNGPGDDIEVGNDQEIDLSEPGREHFFTAPTDTTEG